MQWPIILAGAVTPVDAATNSVVSYILGYGVLGVAAVLFTLRIIVPKSAIDAARADLLRENARLVEEKARAEEQRDAALKIAQEQIVPLLTSFVATSQSLIPLLQELVRRRE